MPNSFANDGAVGAGENVDNSAWAGPKASGSTAPASGGGSGSPLPANSPGNLQFDELAGTRGGIVGAPAPTATSAASMQEDELLGNQKPAASTSTTPASTAQGTPASDFASPAAGTSIGSNIVTDAGPQLGMSFADGGAIDDSDPDQPSNHLAEALQTVDTVMQALYQAHGGSDDSQSDDSTGGPQQQQQAANMPMVPGNQSESGIAPQQPAPGPLPPTSNPFGQRAVRPPARMTAAGGGDPQMAAMDGMPGNPSGGSWQGPTSRPSPSPLPPVSPPGTYRLPRRMVQNQGGIDTGDQA